MSEEPMSTPGPEDISDDDKLWALLSLIFWPVALIALLLEEKKARPFIKHAAVHSLVVGAIATLLALIPVINCFTSIVSLVIWVYMIYLGIQAYGGAWITIPYVSDFAKEQGWL